MDPPNRRTMGDASLARVGMSGPVLGDPKEKGKNCDSLTAQQKT